MSATGSENGLWQTFLLCVLKSLMKQKYEVIFCKNIDFYSPFFGIMPSLGCKTISKEFIISLSLMHYVWE